MSGKQKQNMDPTQPTVYQIRIMGHLSSHWTNQFGGMTIKLEDDGNTLLTSPLLDQAALFGALRKMRDLGMTLVSVKQVPSNENHISTKKGKKK